MANNPLKKFIITIFLIEILSTEAKMNTILSTSWDISAIETRIADSLVKYLQQTESELQNIKRYLRNYEQQVNEDGGVPDYLDKYGDELIEAKLSGNPVHALRLFKRLAIDWKLIKNISVSREWEKVLDVMLETKNIESFRTPELKTYQLIGSDLQSANRNNVSQMSRELLLKEEELNVEECLLLGNLWYNLQNPHQALEWYEEAYKLLTKEENSQIKEKHIKNILESTTIAHFSLLQTFNETQAKDQIQEALEFQNEYNLVDQTKEEIFQNYIDLCKGRSPKKSKNKSSLSCYYSRVSFSYYSLMPGKIEIMHQDPDILIIHDIIRDSEIQFMKTLTNKSVGLINGGHDESNLKFLERRIQAYTGKRANMLDENRRTDFQISSISPGGIHVLNTDSAAISQKRIKQKNSIIKATLMIYLSNVELGGTSTFPSVGISLKPEKGSAIFWSDVESSDNLNKRLITQGCPVLFGTLWVAVKRL